MASDVEICNVALGRLGIDQFIESIDDSNSRARACKNHLSTARDVLLESVDWSFAESQTSLALLTTVVNGWAYQYRYPSDCVRARYITDDNGMRSNATYAAAPFKLSNDDSGVTILTDIENAYLIYTKRITNPNLFSASFRSALSWRLAIELATTLRVDPSLAQNAEMKYRIELSAAAAHDANQSIADVRADSPSIRGRS